MPALTLYANPKSRSRIAMWMLEEIGEPYEAVNVEYGAPMKSPEFLAMNPMGKVPVLTHGDAVVTESPAICAYLADAFPAAGLAPALSDRAAYYRWLFFAAGPVEAAVLARALKLEPSEEHAGQSGFGTVELTFSTLFDRLKASPYLAGDAFSAADVYGGSLVGFAVMFGIMPKTDEVDAYLARIQAREAFQRTIALTQGATP